MFVVATDRHQAHDPQFFLVRGQIGRSAEQPERARILKAAALEAGLTHAEAEPRDRAWVGRVHRNEYLDFLGEASERWRELPDASAEVTANVHPNRVAPTYPKSIVGRAGWHMADVACPVGPQTFSAALASADVAITAAELALGGERRVYGLCRPPGHHAYADMAGGFCFLNNSAIAAEVLRSSFERVAILDIDVHHGNGTQQIFYDRPDVLTISIHADPADYYPFYWGYAHEVGEAQGYGFNSNIVLPVGTSDGPWLGAIGCAVEKLADFSPQAVVLALGLDTHKEDPLQGMSVSTDGLAQAGKIISALDVPIVIIQEGGYLSSALGANLRAFLTAVS